MVPEAVGPNRTQLSSLGICVSEQTRNGFFIGADGGGAIGAASGLITAD